MSIHFLVRSAIIVLVLLVVIAVPAQAETTWVGQKPAADLEYRSEGAAVRVWNSYSNQILAMSLGVEVASFDDNYAYTGKDMYAIRVLGAANVRRGNLPTVTYYSTQASDTILEASGLVKDNEGKWFSLNDIGGFWYYGRLYTRIYVCSNGWAAFQFSGADRSWCPYQPQILPTADTSSSETPDGVLAPLWRDLDPKAGGTIGIRKGSDFLSFVWKQVPNRGSTATNTFVLTFGKDQTIRFEYGSVSTSNPSTSGTKVGFEDPAGVLGQELPLSTVLSYKGVILQFRSYVQLLRTSQFLVDKQDSTDSSEVIWDRGEVSGYNVRASNPSVSSLQQGIVGVVEEVALAGLCAVFGVGTLGCLALGSGVAFTGALGKDLSDVSPDKYVADDLLSTERTGLLQLPVADEQSSSWATDMSAFDVFLWKVPRDAGRHILEIQLGVMLDCMKFSIYYPCSGPLGMFWTGVVLTVTSGGILFTDNFERNPWGPGTDPAEPSWLYWTMSGLWHMTGRQGSDCSCYLLHSAWYGQESTGNYATGSRTFGALTSPLFNLRTAGYVFVYKSWWDTELGTSYDRKLVQISIDRGSTWTTLLQISQATDAARTWVTHTHSLDGYVGKEILLRFHFDSIDSISNNYEGWYIDGVIVWVPGTRPPT